VLFQFSKSFQFLVSIEFELNHCSISFYTVSEFFPVIVSIVFLEIVSVLFQYQCLHHFSYSFFYRLLLLLLQHTVDHFKMHKSNGYQQCGISWLQRWTSKLTLHSRKNLSHRHYKTVYMYPKTYLLWKQQSNANRLNKIIPLLSNFHCLS